MDATDKLGLVKLLHTVFLILTCVLFIVGSVKSYKVEQIQSVTKKINIEITEKINSGSSQSRAKFILRFVIENGSNKDINYIGGVLKVMKADGTELCSLDTYFGTTADTTRLGTTLSAKKKKTFDLKWDMDITDAAIELWNTEFSDLSISYEIIQIRLGNGDVVDVSCEPYVKPASSK